MTRRVVLVTSNPNKRTEAERLLDRPLGTIDIDLPEIQAPTLEEITARKLVEARERVIDADLIVEDVSLGFDELGGFPGPYVRWLLESSGGEGLARIASGLERRTALARCCLGFWDGRESHLFVGEQAGTILTSPRGDRNFGWDPWFMPQGSAKSYAEMTPSGKDEVSHRARAYRMLLEYLQRLG